VGYYVCPIEYLFKYLKHKHKLPLMKKLFFAIAIMIVSLSLTAQDYKPFKVDIALGYAIPGGKGAKGGVLFAIEPKYAVMDQLNLGLRMEAAVVARGYAGTNVEEEMEVDVKASGSYILTGDYYYTSKRSFRPFSGIGAGIYSIAAASVSAGDETAAVGADSKFGGLVRSGFEAGHFRFAVEYNLVPKTKLTTEDAGTIESKNGYIGIKIGATIGGGKKSK
jgi:outer membrane protein W